MIFLQQYKSASRQAEKGRKVRAMRFGVLADEHNSRTEKQESEGFCVSDSGAVPGNPGSAKKEETTEGG